MLSLSEKEISNLIKDFDVHLFTLLLDGWTAGFFILDNRNDFICDLAYFGLVPEAIGKGLGSYLLRMAVKKAWEFNRIKKLTVNTNTLDHPIALSLYKKVGFKLIRSVEETRILSKPWFKKVLL
jgi:GNAT superfamily N-acetyltransferase